MATLVGAPIWKCQDCGTAWYVRLYTCTGCHGSNIEKSAEAGARAWVCQGCSAAWRIKLLTCRCCGGHDIQEGPVPKITVHGGPSDAALLGDDDNEETVVTDVPVTSLAGDAPSPEDATAAPEPQEADGTGTDTEPVDFDADGTLSPEIEGYGTGEQFPPADEPVEAPASNATKAEWQAYAEVLGLDVAGLTKAQIVEAVDATP
jgi:hypothetical protein